MKKVLIILTQYAPEEDEYGAVWYGFDEKEAEAVKAEWAEDGWQAEESRYVFSMEELEELAYEKVAGKIVG